MTIEKLKEILCNVLYLDSSDDIDASLSLFNKYDMNSIDLIDFTYEVKKATGLNIPDGHFWPIANMITDASLYDPDKKEWTSLGLNKVNELFGSHFTSTALTSNDLYDQFSLNYVLKRIDEFKNESNA